MRCKAYETVRTLRLLAHFNIRNPMLFLLKHKKKYYSAILLT